MHFINRRKQSAESIDSPWIFIQDLPRGTTQQQIKRHVSKTAFVKEQDIYVEHTDMDPNPKDRARIECWNNEAASKLVEAFNGTEFNGSTIKVTKLSPRTGRVLEIGNLAPDVTEQDIAHHISDLAHLEDPPKHIQLRSSGKALITFDLEEDVLQTMRKLNASTLKGNTIYVYRPNDRNDKSWQTVKSRMQFALRKKQLAGSQLSGRKIQMSENTYGPRLKPKNKLNTYEPRLNKRQILRKRGRARK